MNILNFLTFVIFNKVYCAKYTLQDLIGETKQYEKSDKSKTIYEVENFITILPTTKK